MGPDLLRQRRNLLVVSLALIFSNLAGAEFNNKVAVMGTEITFTRSWALLLGAWLLWGYFLIRYLQYAGEIPNLGIKRSVHEKMLAYMRRNAGVPTKRSDGMGQLVDYEISGSSFLRWKVTSGEYQPQNSEVDSHDVILGRWIGLWWFLRASTAVALATPKVTDYVLPIVVACTAPLVCVTFWILK